MLNDNQIEVDKPEAVQYYCVHKGKFAEETCIMTTYCHLAAHLYNWTREVDEVLTDKHARKYHREHGARASDNQHNILSRSPLDHFSKLKKNVDYAVWFAESL